ncbi:hypothetical protein NA56DRAFT_255394 [Hyaloscypha hepaticicola]|uniref:Uncharacterized protein n=1 Tax=Hyaloscypha hepaticicola TaxID=2082293 RepID=A0A2J6PVF9_9HELO|nr:hypothetical protein NA56DRAFT_255394 [Hyaloscypha hepaticicola]
MLPFKVVLPEVLDLEYALQLQRDKTLCAVECDQRRYLIRAMLRVKDKKPPLVKNHLTRSANRATKTEKDLGARPRPNLLLLNINCRNAEFVLLKKIILIHFPVRFQIFSFLLPSASKRYYFPQRERFQPRNGFRFCIAKCLLMALTTDCSCSIKKSAIGYPPHFPIQNSLCVKTSCNGYTNIVLHQRFISFATPNCYRDRGRK